MCGSINKLQGLAELKIELELEPQLERQFQLHFITLLNRLTSSMETHTVCQSAPPLAPCPYPK